MGNAYTQSPLAVARVEKTQPLPSNLTFTELIRRIRPSHRTCYRMSYNTREISEPIVGLRNRDVDSANCIGSLEFEIVKTWNLRKSEFLKMQNAA